MDILTSFITPNIAALVIAISGIITITNKTLPMLKKSKVWKKLLPWIPVPLGIGLALLPGVIEIPEGTTWSQNYGNMIVIGIACAGIATVTRNGIKQLFKKEDKGE